jgi:hypothetical protein
MFYFTRVKAQYCFRNVTNTAQIFERAVTPILTVRCRNVVWITGFSQEPCFVLYNVILISFLVIGIV